MVLIGTPETCAVQVGAEAVIAFRQGKDSRTILIGDLAVAAVGCAVEGIYIQTAL